MSTIPYCYLAPSLWDTDVLLDGQEAVHLTQVLRIREGSDVHLLDGQGRTGLFRVREVRRKNVRLAQISVTTAEPPVSRPCIALALSKAVRRGFFLEKAVELGACGIYLWQADRSQGRIQESMRETLTRQMIAGAKQSHNPWLPEIDLFPDGLAPLLRATGKETRRILPWELEASTSMVPFDLLGMPGRTLYVIGPEGGFSGAELALLEEERFRKVSLGERVLRCETAATLCLGLHWWAANVRKVSGQDPSSSPGW